MMLNRHNLLSLFQAKPQEIVLGHAVAPWWRPAKKYILSDTALLSHLLLSGAAGTGAYSQVTDLLMQQTLAGRGWLLVDPYDDDATRNALYAVATAAGRAGEFFAVSMTESGPVPSLDVKDLLTNNRMCYVQVPYRERAAFLTQFAAHIIEALLAEMQYRTASKPVFMLAVREPQLFNAQLLSQASAAASAARVSLILQSQDSEALCTSTAPIAQSAATHIVFRQVDPLRVKASLARIGLGTESQVNADMLRSLEPGECFVRSQGVISHVRASTWSARHKKEPLA